MPEDSMTPGLQGLIDLINAPNKRAAKKLCKELIVGRRDLYELIIAGRSGFLEPYRYACHFSEFTPADAPPTSEQMLALTKHGSGPFTGQAKRAVTRLFHSIDTRRMFAAHLFYLPEQDFWSLLYFDQRDRSEYDNHWSVGGSHIHYSSEAFTNDSMQDMWRAICQIRPRAPSSEHLRYRDEIANEG